MKKIGILFVLVPHIFSFTQKSGVDSIQQYCDEVNDGAQSGALLCAELSVDFFYPGIGEQTTRLKFYYDLEQDDTGQMLPPVLSKVLVEYGVASSIFFYIEYFYNEKGDLIFHYLHSTGYECGEKRFYFEEGRLLKLKVNPIDDDHCVKSALVKKYGAYERTGDFEDEDRAEADNAIKKADEYKEIFTAVIAADGVEK